MLPKQPKREMVVEEDDSMHDLRDDLQELHDLPGTSNDDAMSRHLQQQLVQAAQECPPMEDPTFRDPLGDYCDQSTFNIIQFLAENDTPSVSPANPRGLQHPQHLQQQQQLQQQQIMPAQHNNNGDLSGRVPLQNSSRLPDSPPITDVSTAGSSASPSSNADSPYSPENYPNYSVLSHHNGNNSGLILGVNDLQSAQPMLDSMQIIPGMQPAPGMRQQQMNTSPHAMYLHSPYTNGPHTQISPPASAPIRGNNGQQHYAMQYNPIQNDVFTDMVAAGSDNADIRPAKRMRTEIPPQSQVIFDRSRVKPDPMQMQYPPRGYAQTPAVMASSPIGGESYMDENFQNGTGEQVIKFNRFNEENWHKLYCSRQTELRQIQVHVVADKGFNYSPIDGCFVNQKKNHFQISVNIEANDDASPHYVAVNGNLLEVADMKLAFCGVKSEMVTSDIQIKQSQTDRKPIPHDPVALEIPPRQLTKITVPRLHFSETTMNNQRKNTRPNPDQKYFLLLVRLLACTKDGGQHLVQAYASEKVIVRATNPGQFEPPDTDVAWGKTGNFLHTAGQVGIGTDRALAPGAILNVHGDIAHVGRMVHPSDRRLKDGILDIDAQEAMDFVNNVRIVRYKYKDGIADQWGLSEQSRHRVGVIAQELHEIMPEAVNTNGEFYTVDDSRMFYHNIAATKELSRLHNVLEDEIDGKVEAIQKTLGKIFRKKPADGDSTSASVHSDSALVDAKAMSLAGSRYSLASNFKKEIAKNRNSCHNPGCRRTDGGSLMCSTKMTQGTIVCLVIVMAVCLLAMSALYVLDWHHRNYGVHSIVGPTPAPNMTASTDGVGLMKTIPSIPPHGQPNAPPIHALCAHKYCQSYCCAERSFYKTETKHGGLNPDNPLPLAGSRESFLSAIAGIDQVSPKAFFPKPLASGVRFELLNMNMTLDQRYCHGHSCDPRTGRYTLFIPVSPYMPTAPIHIRIESKDGMVINNCGPIAEISVMDCVAPEPHHSDFLANPLSFESEEGVYELTAGMYLKSAYRFRIGYTSEACYGVEDGLRGAFEQYDLIFYRTCVLADHDSTHAPE